MLIQDEYLQTRKFTAAQRTTQGPMAIQVIAPHPGVLWAWY